MMPRLLRSRAAPAAATSLARALGLAAPGLAGRTTAVANIVTDPNDPNPLTWSNPAAVLHGIDDLRFQDWGLPEDVPPGCVRIETKSVGICGSDIHYLKQGRIGDFVLQAPMVIGHEAAGRVVRAAPDVQGLQEGDRVALEPGVPCWSSGIARKGRYNLDPGIRFLATPPHHGSLSQLVDHPSEFCYRLPPDLSYDQGAMAEPLSVAIHAVKRAKVRPGKAVAVLGAGPIGLLTMQCAKAFGADAVAVTDLKAFNLDVADELGADVTFMPRPGMTPGEVAEQLRYMVQARGLDAVIDCVGVEDSVQAGMASASCGGRVVLVGMGQPRMQLDLAPLVLREIDLIGSFRYANTYPLAIRLMEDKRVDVMRLITHRFGFSAEEVAAGFQAASNSAETNAIKVMFDLS